MLRWTPVAPFPRPVFKMCGFWDSVWLKLTLFFYSYAYGNPIGNLDHTRKTRMCTCNAAHTVVLFVLLLQVPSGPLGNTSENARCTLPDTHQRLLRWTQVAPFPRPVFKMYGF